MALAYHSYRLLYRSQRYNEGIPSPIAKLAKRFEVQSNSQILDGFDPFIILSFLPRFQRACDVTGIHEGAPRWIFLFS